MQIRVLLMRAGVVAAMVIASALCCAPAYAWRGERVGSTFVIARESTDATMSGWTVRAYYDYKGGADWVSGQPLSATSSYVRSTDQVSLVATQDGCAISLPSEYRCQLVVLYSNAGGVAHHFGVLNDVAESRASVVGTPTVDVRSMPNVGSVSLDGTPTVSLSATSTVGVDSVGGIDADGLTLAVAVGLVAVGGYLWRESL